MNKKILFGVLALFILSFVAVSAFAIEWGDKDSNGKDAKEGMMGNNQMQFNDDEHFQESKEIMMKNPAIKAAIDANDYNAFVQAVAAIKSNTENQESNEFKISQEEFTILVQRNKQETVMRATMQKVTDAIKNNDFKSWEENMNSLFEQQQAQLQSDQQAFVTQQNFDQMTKMMEMRKNNIGIKEKIKNFFHDDNEGEMQFEDIPGLESFSGSRCKKGDKFNDDFSGNKQMHNDDERARGMDKNGNQVNGGQDNKQNRQYDGQQGNNFQQGNDFNAEGNRDMNQNNDDTPQKSNDGFWSKLAFWKK